MLPDFGNGTLSLCALKCSSSSEMSLSWGSLEGFAGLRVRKCFLDYQPILSVAQLNLITSSDTPVGTPNNSMLASLSVPCQTLLDDYLESPTKFWL